MVAAGASTSGDCGPGDVIVKYVGQKISKIRWAPSLHGHLRASSTFATGSWDDSDNNVSVWSIDEQQEDDGNLIASEEPQLICQAQHSGCVTEMKFLDSLNFVTTSSLGSLQLYNISQQSKKLNILRQWSGLHHQQGGSPCNCTSVALNFPKAYTCGEDGRLAVVNLENGELVETIDCADSTTIFGVTCVGMNEVVTVSMCGNVKLWDFRDAKSKPAKCMSVSGEKVPLLSVDRHPNQAHLLVTGGGDGVVGIWDLRQESFPVQLVEAHQSEVWEVKFHPLKADNMFTCSEDGSAWYWDGSSLTGKADARYTSASARLPVPPQGGKTRDVSGLQSSSSCAWMYIDANKHRLQTFSLMPFSKLPVNSIDIESDTLLCGTDGEAVICIKDIPTC